MALPLYLDHHATTPCDPRVVEAMLPYFTEKFGNAGSRSHSYGLQANAAVEHARTQVADLIGASPKEIVFTSGATEADNLAVLGVAMAAGGGHIVTTSIEHSAVLDAVKHAGQNGFHITVVPVGESGIVDAQAVIDALRDDTVLVSVMLANNEVGTVQPVGDIGAVTRARGIPLHTDAVQAAGRLPLDVAALNVDLLSLTAHKMYGPKGVGALYVRRGPPKVHLEPLFHGGGQERGHRPGTLAVPLIVALGAAAELARLDVTDGHIHALSDLRDRLWRGLQERVAGLALNGAWRPRLPHNLNVSIERIENRALMADLRGDVAVSSGSACSSATLTPSRILKAMGLDDVRANAAIRFGLGRWTTADDIDRTVHIVADKVEALRARSPLHGGA